MRDQTVDTVLACWVGSTKGGNLNLPAFSLKGAFTFITRAGALGFDPVLGCSTLVRFYATDLDICELELD